jgi:hypothetical protein
MATPEALEFQLRDDLRSLGPRLEDERLVQDLYHALTRTLWSRFDRDGSVSLSFTRAEALLNELRAERGAEPLPLAQTGHEGEISERVEDVLRELGWRVQPLDTGEHDERHLDDPESPPPSPPQDTLARGHREADEGRPVPRNAPSSR